MTDDRNRIDQSLKELDRISGPPAFFAFHFRGVGDALMHGGTDAGIRALGKLDEHLAQIRDSKNSPFGKRTFTFLISTAGYLPLSWLINTSSCSKIAEVTGISDEACVPLGGMALIRGAAIANLGKLTKVPDFSGTVYVRGPKSVSVVDSGLGGPREPSRFESADAELLKRFQDSLLDGEAVWLPADLTVITGRGHSGIPAVRFGGTSPEERHLTVLVAGPEMAVSREPVQIETLRQLAPVATALLGIKQTGSASVPILEALKGAVPKAPQYLGACRALAHGSSDSLRACENELHHASSREQAAEALTSLVLERYRTLDESDAAETLRVASWLSHRAMLGVLETAKAPAPHAIDASGNCEPDARVLVLTSASKLRHSDCRLSIPVGVSSISGHGLAQIVARFSGARVVVWQGDRGTTLTASTPELHQWRGPEWFEEPTVADDSNAVASYRGFSVGIEEFFAGRSSRSVKEFGLARALSPQARAWLALVRQQIAGTSSADKASDQTTLALVANGSDSTERWPAVLAQALDPGSTFAYSTSTHQLDAPFAEATRLAMSKPPDVSSCQNSSLVIPATALDPLQSTNSFGLLAMLHAKMGMVAPKGLRPSHFEAALNLAERPEARWVATRVYRLVDMYAPTDSTAGVRAHTAIGRDIEATVGHELFHRSDGYEERILSMLDDASNMPSSNASVDDWSSLYVAALQDTSVRRTFERRISKSLSEWNSWLMVALSGTAPRFSAGFRMSTNAYLQTMPADVPAGVTPAACIRAARALLQLVPQMAGLLTHSDPEALTSALEMLSDVRALGGADDLARAAANSSIATDTAALATRLRLLGASVESLLSWRRSSTWETLIENGNFDLLLSLGKAAVSPGLKPDSLARLEAVVELVRELGPAMHEGRSKDLHHIDRVAHALDRARDKRESVVTSLKRGVVPTEAPWLPYLEAIALDSLWYFEAKSGTPSSKNQLADIRPKLVALVSPRHGTRLLDALVTPIAEVALAFHDNLDRLASDNESSFGTAILHAIGKSHSAFEDAVSDHRIMAGLAADQPGYLVPFWIREFTRSAVRAPDLNRTWPRVKRASWDLLRHLAREERPNTIVYLAFALTLLPGKTPSDAPELMDRASTSLQQTPFQNVGSAYDRIRYIVAQTLSKPALAARALEAESAQCPGLAWETSFLRALLFDNAGDSDSAVRELEKYRRGGQLMRTRSGVGASGTEAMLRTKVRGDSELRTDGTASRYVFDFILERKFSLDVTGSRRYQVGYGFESHSNADTVSARPTFEPTIEVTPVGTGDDAETIGLITEAFVGLRHSKHRIVERALARLQNVLAGRSEDVLEPNSKTPIAASGPALQTADVSLLLWLGTIAELNGHEILGRNILNSTQKFPRERYAGLALQDCPKDRSNHDGESWLLEAARCRIPYYFENHAAREALREIVYLRARQLVRGPVKDDLLQEAITRARKLAPDWIPALKQQGGAGKAVRGAMKQHVGTTAVVHARALSFASGPEATESADTPAVASLLESGYACEIATALIRRSDAHPTLAPAFATVCGIPELRLSALLASARRSGQFEQAYANVDMAVDLAVRLRTWNDDITQVLGELLNREAVAPDRLAERIRHVATRVPFDELPTTNVRLRTFAIAADVLARSRPAEIPESVFYDAQRSGTSTQQTLLLRYLIYRPSDAAAAVDEARKTLGITSSDKESVRQ